HGPKRRLLVERIAEQVPPGEIDEAIDEGVVHVGMHIDALDAAAALAGVEIDAVDDVLDRVLQVDVGAHIGRVLAAKLEPDARERSGRGALDRFPGRDRTGEAY